METKALLNLRQVSFGNSQMLHCVIILGMLNSHNDRLLCEDFYRDSKSIDCSAVSVFFEFNWTGSGSSW